MIMVAVIISSAHGAAKSARAEEVRMAGSIVRIVMAADGTSVSAVVKDNKNGELVPVLIADDLTVDKFKEKQMVEGDEIRCKLHKAAGGNTSRLFKKVAGS